MSQRAKLLLRRVAGTLLILFALAGSGVEIYHEHKVSALNVGFLGVTALWGWLLVAPDLTKQHATLILGWVRDLFKAKGAA